MKLSKNFIFYNISGENVIVGLNQEVFSGVIKLNDTAAFIVSQLSEERSVEELMGAIQKEYDGVDESTARKAVLDVVEELDGVGAIE